VSKITIQDSVYDDLKQRGLNSTVLKCLFSGDIFSNFREVCIPETQTSCLLDIMLQFYELRYITIGASCCENLLMIIFGIGGFSNWFVSSPLYYMDYTGGIISFIVTTESQLQQICQICRVRSDHMQQFKQFA
jgi:hypothetical protein